MDLVQGALADIVSPCSPKQTCSCMYLHLKLCLSGPWVQPRPGVVSHACFPQATFACSQKGALAKGNRALEQWAPNA